jgi:hypothetical protein
MGTETEFQNVAPLDWLNITTTLEKDKAMTINSNQFRCLQEQALEQVSCYGDLDLLSLEMRTVVLETADEVYEDLLEESVDLYRPSDRRLARSYRPSLAA